MTRTLSLVAATRLAMPAMAQDGGPLRPGERVGFGGAYGGAMLGSGFAGLGFRDGVDVDGDGFLTPLDTALAAEAESFDFDGLVYGLHGGYGVQVGALYGGAEVSILGGDLTKDVADTTPGTDEFLALRLDYVARVMLRGGIARDRDIFYGLAGGAYFDGEDGLSETGVAYGVGYERAVSASASLGVQYVRHEFDDVDGRGFDTTIETVEARYNFRF